MITLDEVKKHLNDETIDEIFGEKIIAYINSALKQYTNNPDLDNEDGLDIVRLSLCAKYLNRDLKGTQGMNSRNVGSFGVSITQVLDEFEKGILRSYVRATFL
jgi:hypothetical protein